jgi:phage shock protein PspC (stress-responsive transcriptional regulator)
VDQVKGMVSGIANSFGAVESSLKVLPVLLAVALLADVAIGARDYDGKP